jgi:hypothetical protein
MEPTLHGPQGKGRMLRGIVGQEHRVHVVPDKIIERIIKRDAQLTELGLLLPQNFRRTIAERNHLYIFKPFGIAEHYGTPDATQDTHPDFFLHNLPPLGIDDIIITPIPF